MSLIKSLAARVLHLLERYLNKKSQRLSAAEIFYLGNEVGWIS